MTIKPGRIRLKLTDTIIKKFTDDGLEVRVDPSKLWPAEGYWRTSMVDCYAWEGQIELRRLGHHKFQTIPIGSYERMSDCAKGFSWRDEHVEIVIFADNPIPISQRCKRGA